MGIFRKVTSMSTLGAVDYRSSRDRKRRAETEESKANAKLAKSTAKSQRIEAKAAKDMARTAKANGPTAPVVPPPPPPVVAQSSPVGAVSVAEELARLAGLQKSGVISKKEFAQAKARLLG